MKRTEEEAKPVTAPSKGRPKTSKDRKRTNGEGSIYQRPDGLWVGQVVIGRSAQTGDLVKKYIYGRDQGDVVAKKNKLLQEKRDVIDLDADTVTVEEWVDHYLKQYAKSRVRENTYASYRWMLDRYIKKHLGTIRLGKLRSIQIQSMVNKILDNGCSARTAEYAFAVLRASIRQALKEEILLRDPTLAVLLPHKKRQEIKPLTEQQWVSLFQAAAAESPQFHMEILVEWATGLRRSELLGLRWSDIDLNLGTLTVNRAVMNGAAGPTMSETKTDASRRTLALPPTIITELKDHKRKQAAKKLKSEVWRSNDLVFPSSVGTPQEPSAVSRTFAHIATKIGLIGVSFHKLRHDHASRLVMAGIHVKKIQAQLGHSNISVTMDTYSHLAPNARDEISALLENTLPNQKIITKIHQFPKR